MRSADAPPGDAEPDEPPGAAGPGRAELDAEERGAAEADSAIADSAKAEAAEPGAARHGGKPAGADTGVDYTGALYGSLLAASVLAGAEAVGHFPRVRLDLLLIITGLVFWAAHVYSHLAGQRGVGHQWSGRAIMRAALDEWGIVEAAVLPAIAVAISALFSLSLSATVYFALSVAIGEQVVWACAGAARAGASRPQIAVEAVVNLVLGLIIIASKAALGH